MTLGFNIQHLFKNNIDNVTRTYLELHNHNNDVKSVEKMDTVIENDMECVTRKLTLNNWFSSFFRRIKILDVNEIEMHEEIWSQKSENRYWLRSRNLTWEDQFAIAKVVYICPYENNPNWTNYEETFAVDFSYLGKLGRALELYAKRKFESNSKQDIRLVEKLLKN